MRGGRLFQRHFYPHCVIKRFSCFSMQSTVSWLNILLIPLFGSRIYWCPSVCLAEPPCNEFDVFWSVMSCTGNLLTKVKITLNLGLLNIILDLEICRFYLSCSPSVYEIFLGDLQINYVSSYLLPTIKISRIIENLGTHKHSHFLGTIRSRWALLHPSHHECTVCVHYQWGCTCRCPCNGRPTLYVGDVLSLHPRSSCHQGTPPSSAQCCKRCKTCCVGLHLEEVQALPLKYQNLLAIKDSGIK